LCTVETNNTICFNFTIVSLFVFSVMIENWRIFGTD